jgi:uncharacterized protein
MTDEPEIVDDKERSRYEVHEDGGAIAVADYVKQPGIVSFTHTETFAGHKGQGHAGRMIDRALRDARDEELEVVPFCWFVAEYIGAHTEFLPLVPVDRRAEFGLPS